MVSNQLTCRSKRPGAPQNLATPGEVGIDEDTFRRLARAYRRRCRVDLCTVRPDGRIVFGRAPKSSGDDRAAAQSRAFVVQEAWRWGEPTVSLCPQRRLQWGVPLMNNGAITGGLVAGATEERVFTGTATSPPLDIRRVCTELRRLAEHENLTNAAALELRRREYHDEQQRAYAIHDVKATAYHGIRRLYLREEPALFSAIRAADRREAREILNRILVAIYRHAGGRLDLVKSFLLELIVSMCRTAVEAGGDPEKLLGANFARMTDLARVDAEDQLTLWITRTLEHLMDAIRRNRGRDAGTRLFDAVAHMERHCCERISRNDVARTVHLSPSHFSYLLRKESGATFTDLLNRMRVAHAAELIVRTDRSLLAIGFECGFRDQSYFTKVFKRYRRLPPLQYRRQVRQGTEQPAASLASDSAR